MQFFVLVNALCRGSSYQNGCTLGEDVWKYNMSDFIKCKKGELITSHSSHFCIYVIVVHGETSLYATGCAMGDDGWKHYISHTSKRREGRTNEAHSLYLFFPSVIVRDASDDDNNNDNNDSMTRGKQVWGNRWTAVGKSWKLKWKE